MIRTNVMTRYAAVRAIIREGVDRWMNGACTVESYKRLWTLPQDSVKSRRSAVEDHRLFAELQRQARAAGMAGAGFLVVGSCQRQLVNAAGAVPLADI